MRRMVTRLCGQVSRGPRSVCDQSVAPIREAISPPASVNADPAIKAPAAASGGVASFIARKAAPSHSNDQRIHIAAIWNKDANDCFAITN